MGHFRALRHFVSSRLRTTWSQAQIQRSGSRTNARAGRSGDVVCCDARNRLCKERDVLQKLLGRFPSAFGQRPYHTGI